MTVKKIADHSRRRFLSGLTSVMGAIGAGAMVAPFVMSMNPSERAKNAGAPVQVDIKKLETGQQITVEWQGKPIWVLHRTAENINSLSQPDILNELSDPDSDFSTQQPDYAQNAYRSIKQQYLVVIALCTHLGCVPTYRPDRAPADLGEKWLGGYFCPCHGSRFDLAGRVYKNVPAPTNLIVPPHRYVTETIIEIGTENI